MRLTLPGDNLALVRQLPASCARLRNYMLVDQNRTAITVTRRRLRHHGAQVGTIDESLLQTEEPR